VNSESRGWAYAVGKAYVDAEVDKINLKLDTLELVEDLKVQIAFSYIRSL
jgi:hypothetical protein